MIKEVETGNPGRLPSNGGHMAADESYKYELGKTPINTHRSHSAKISASIYDLIHCEEPHDSYEEMYDYNRIEKNWND
jgi:hypothetical protein